MTFPAVCWVDGQGYNKGFGAHSHRNYIASDVSLILGNQKYGPQIFFENAQRVWMDKGLSFDVYHMR
jgi:hypothetical protein